MREVARRAPRAPVLGLRANLPQFLLLVAVNALVGGMVGQERTVVPLLAESEFGLSAYAGMLSFIAVFGVTKALVNLVAGQLADRFGRKPVLIAGWLVGLPVPLILIFAPSWGWVIAANVLLGVNQGLAWSLTVIMKIDLAGPHRRGLAMGLNEGAGYGAVALAAWATGAIAEATSLRPGPFLLGLAFAALGLGLSATVVRETAGHVAAETAGEADRAGGDRAEPADQRGRPEQPATLLSAREVFAMATWRNRSLSAVSQAGLVNNLNGAAWGLIPIVFAAAGLPVAQVGLLTAVAPAVWGVGQLATGWWSDRVGRKRLIAAGQWTEAAGLTVIAAGGSFWVWAVGSALFGAGTALAYPILLAAVGDLAHPAWRGAAVGVYRLWRDLDFAVGAVLAGWVADASGPAIAIAVVAAITAASGLDVATRMRETAARAERSPATGSG